MTYRRFSSFIRALVSAVVDRARHTCKACRPEDIAHTDPPLHACLRFPGSQPTECGPRQVPRTAGFTRRSRTAPFPATWQAWLGS